MRENSEPTKFGTFGGVFTPCTLTILGVIMFLRSGEVVGQSGLINALLIVIAAKTITTLLFHFIMVFMSLPSQGGKWEAPCILKFNIPNIVASIAAWIFL